MSQIKEKAPETAATVQSAQVNNQVQDTILQEKMQELHSVFWNIGSDLESLAFQQEQIVDLLRLLYEHLDDECTCHDKNDAPLFAALLPGRMAMFLSLLYAVTYLTEDVKNSILTTSDRAYAEGRKCNAAL